MARDGDGHAVHRERDQGAVGVEGGAHAVAAQRARGGVGDGRGDRADGERGDGRAGERGQFVAAVAIDPGAREREGVEPASVGRCVGGGRVVPFPGESGLGLGEGAGGERLELGDGLGVNLPDGAARDVVVEMRERGAFPVVRVDGSQAADNVGGLENLQRALEGAEGGLE